MHDVDFKILVGPSKGSYINYVMHLSGVGGSGKMLPSIM